MYPGHVQSRHRYGTISSIPSWNIANSVSMIDTPEGGTTEVFESPAAMKNHAFGKLVEEMKGEVYTEIIVVEGRNRVHLTAAQLFDCDDVVPSE